MNRRDPLLVVLALAALATHAAASPPAGTGTVAAPVFEAPSPRPRPLPPGAVVNDGQAYPLYRWPLERALRDGLLTVNYVDHDPGAGVLDYMGGAHTYDTHAGTDYTLFDFRLMDRGCRIHAAAPGTVVYAATVAPGAFDRNCGDRPWPDDGNWLWVAHGDGTYSSYYHLRSWSMTVGIGDAVQTGQVLGLVGSSGYSTAPHLHFETGDYFSGPYLPRDPATGPANPLPSLWTAQEDYAGDDPLWFAGLGVFSDAAAAGGSVFNTTYCDVQEGIAQPLVLGIHEPHVNLVVRFQGNAGDPFRIELRKPDHTVWAAFDDVLTYDARFDWFWAYWFWDGAVAEADTGMWTARAYSNGVLSLETPFRVGASTVYGPRLHRAGRSFRIDGTTQRDTLRLRPLGAVPPVTFAIAGTAHGATLQDSIVAIGPASTQPTRSHFFQVVATDAAARRDTAWYHVVDPSKPLESVVGVGDPPAAARGSGLVAAPLPARGRTTFTFEGATTAPAALVIHDAAGRRVRRLDAAAFPGTRQVTWDGRDDAGRALPAGLYFAARIDPGEGSARRAIRVALTR